MIFCIVTAFKFISSLENCIYRSVSHVWRNSILNGPLCLAYFRLSDCKDDAWSVRHAKIQSRWKKGAVSFLQCPSVLFSFLRFLYFCGPDYLGAWNRLLYTPQSFSSPELRSFWPAPSGELWLAGAQKGPCKTRSSARLQRSETMTITIDYNKETFCACMLSWSQKELQLLLIRGADDKERSSGARNE